ncbi:MAG: preprotein translocase subunit SecY [Planctomycetes bacterium]|nr:preprotein translocase subunit SecY [Planctomycetota bacterium]
MFGKLITLFKIPELRRKILFTLALLAVYRMGFWVPLPIIDQGQLQKNIELMQQGQGGGMGQIMQVVALFSAAQIGNATIFGLGIMPYISAAIIFELLASVYPPLEQLRKEGEAGRKKINEYTRYATVFICLGQSYFWIRGLAGGMLGADLVRPEYNSFYWHLVCTLTMTAGTILLMWIGEQIDAYGIGNGISLLIMAGIIARMPGAGRQLFQQASLQLGADMGIEKILLLAALFVFVVVWVLAITEGQRRIPIQSAKHVRGRRILGGQRQFLPLRVNQAGVMPIIFASSLLMFPWFLFGQLSRMFPDSRVLAMLADTFGGGRGYVYNVCYIILIYFFCYFWTAITFNPKDMADNLKDYGSFIPGYRPGRRTAAYLEQVMVRITYVGAAFLAIVAVIPTIVATSMGIPYLIASFYGGTGLLIVVSVELDLIQKIDSHLVMRNYPGLLEVETKKR